MPARPDLEALKQRLATAPDIVGRDKYLNSAVLIPLVWQADEYHLLFQKRAANIRQGGEICFPGGRVDATDADFEATAIRETIEELGIAREQIEVLGRFGTVITSIGALVEAFVGVLHIDGLDACHIHPHEVERLFLLPLAYFQQHPPEIYHVRLETQASYVDADGAEVVLLPAKALGLPDRYHRSWGRRQSRVLVYQTPEDVIWGITADMVFEFTRLVFGILPAEYLRRTLL